MICCLNRKENNEKFKKDFKNLSDRNLKRKMNNLKINKRRNCCFGTLFGITSVGTIIATAASVGSSAAITAPAVAVATVSAGENFYQMYENNTKMNVINEILESRKDNEIEFIDNQNAISIIRKK